MDNIHVILSAAFRFFLPDRTGRSNLMPCSSLLRNKGKDFGDADC